MKANDVIWPEALRHLIKAIPDRPVLYFAPSVLRKTVQRFSNGFDGLLSYAVKANDSRRVLEEFIESGVTAFDVASPAEMRKVRSLSANVAMHYNNPVRSPAEIEEAITSGVVSYAVDGHSELNKLIDRVSPHGIEIAVRLHLPVAGAAWDFGEKFGESPEAAVELLKKAKSSGFIPALTFHPGTQCTDPEAWRIYIQCCADVATRAGVQLARLNVGGGFPSCKSGDEPDLEAIFSVIHETRDNAFGNNMPQLVCEPGRALVAESFILATRVKSVRECGSVFLNDGIYGSLAEAPLLGTGNRIATLRSDGGCHHGPSSKRYVYGPTCDSVDRLPEAISLPEVLKENDYVLFWGMGAYSTATLTRFNGYGSVKLVTV